MQALVSSGALFGLDEDQWGLFEGKYLSTSKPEYLLNLRHFRPVNLL